MKAWKWWPNWYVTRLHAVEWGKQAVCGTWTVDPSDHRSEWRVRRLSGDVPKCQHCLRKTDAPTDSQNEDKA